MALFTRLLTTNHGLKLALVLVAVAAALTLNGARASNFPGPYANGLVHTYAFSSLSSDGQTAANWGMSRVAATDNMSKLKLSSCVIFTDVCYRDGYYEVAGNGIYTATQWETFLGVYVCEANFFVTCLQASIYFDESDIHTMTTNALRSLGCHETGHSLGVGHGASGSWSASGSSALYWDSHDLNNINGYYE